MMEGLETCLSGTTEDGSGCWHWELVRNADESAAKVWPQVAKGRGEDYIECGRLLQ